MSKTLKLIFVALGLIILGGAMFFIIAGANHFDFNVSQNIEKKTYNVEENFTKISIDNKTADICFYESNELKVIGSDKNELQSLIILVNLISEIKEVSLFCEIQIE